jgi:hypothetical protein
MMQMIDAKKVSDFTFMYGGKRENSKRLVSFELLQNTLT